MANLEASNAPAASMFGACSDPASSCSCPPSMMLIIPPPPSDGGRTIAYCQSMCTQCWNKCSPVGSLAACFGNYKHYRPECTIATSIHRSACGNCNPKTTFGMYHGEQFCFLESPESTMTAPCSTGLHGSCIKLGKTFPDCADPLDQLQLARLSGSKCPDPVGCAAHVLPSNAPSNATINAIPANPFDCELNRTTSVSKILP